MIDIFSFALSGEIVGKIDPLLKSSHPELFKAGAVILARRVLIMTSGWSSTNIHLDKLSVYAGAAPGTSADDQAHEGSDSLMFLDSEDADGFVDSVERLWDKLQASVT